MKLEKVTKQPPLAIKKKLSLKSGKQDYTREKALARIMAKMGG